jgi:ABC-type transport system substrate-binding protein
MIRRTLTALAALALLLGSTTSVFAAPSNAPTSFTVPIECGGQTLMITLNAGRAGEHGQGEPTIFNPAFVSDGGGLLIPTVFTFMVTDASGNVLFSESDTKGQGKMSGLQDRLVTCTFSETFTDPETGQTLTFSGTATVFMPGATR